jgi:hypothetical protein
MFGKSVSESWTYIAIISRLGGMTHYMQQFTLPSNQTKYQNNNNDAMHYYCANLNLKDSVEGCVAAEDYDMDPPRVGISINLAIEQRRDRQRKFDEQVKAAKYMGVDPAKTEYTEYVNLDVERVMHELKLDKENRKSEETEHFDTLFDEIFQSPEFQSKYSKMIQDFTLDIVQRMLVTELATMLKEDYVKKSDI